MVYRTLWEDAVALVAEGAGCMITRYGGNMCIWNTCNTCAVFIRNMVICLYLIIVSLYFPSCDNTDSKERCGRSDRFGVCSSVHNVPNLAGLSTDMDNVGNQTWAIGMLQTIIISNST